ncbi:hypothetical protein [Gracilibacillus lacisalsi]|uniref:hypothetical protein n=1 Tax=Gracilibacillus lacisalsi TaxID=393087 RepID=UPI0003A140F6|nr:hypothetical protein [Gracilibacillus lacisalsi]
MDILDVIDWKVDDKRQISGTREKYWIIEPYSNKSFMFKIPTKDTGEAWAEKVASEIGKLIGLNMMDVQFGFRKNTLGVVAKKFTNGSDEFYEGGDLIISEDGRI